MLSAHAAGAAAAADEARARFDRFTRGLETQLVNAEAAAAQALQPASDAEPQRSAPRARHTAPPLPLALLEPLRELSLQAAARVAARLEAEPPLQDNDAEAYDAARE